MLTHRVPGPAVPFSDGSAGSTVDKAPLLHIHPHSESWIPLGITRQRGNRGCEKLRPRRTGRERRDSGGIFGSVSEGQCQSLELRREGCGVHARLCPSHLHPRKGCFFLMLSDTAFELRSSVFLRIALLLLYVAKTTYHIFFLKSTNLNDCTMLFCSSLDLYTGSNSAQNYLTHCLTAYNLRSVFLPFST